MRRLAIFLAVMLVPLAFAGDARAQQPQILISEIHYHPLAVGDGFPNYDDREDTEFIEIVNLGPNATVVDGWCFTDGIDFCFDPGTTLAIGDPIVLARDAAAFTAIYGTAPDGEYDGRLANGGETVTLRDAAFAIVTSVAWATSHPWPVSPDGDGPSLELVTSAGTNGDPANWVASSVTGGTPGTVPSLSGAAPPLVTSHAAPGIAIAGSPIAVVASAVNETSVSVTYDINFGPGTTVAMTANAGAWQASLPALSIGDVLRYRFEASGPGGTTTSPRVEDSIDWWAIAVPTNPAAGVPVLDIHISDAQWSQIEARNCGCNAVIVHDGRVWTDVEMRRAGLTSIGLPKGHYRLDFPDGHPFEASWLDGTSDELTIDMGWPNVEIIREQLSWDLMGAVGFAPIQTQHVRVTRNGTFHGLYLMRDEQDGDWRSRNDFDNGPFYKFDQFGGREGWAGGWEKKEALDEPDTDLAALLSCTQQTGAALRACYLDTVDVAQLAHEFAAIWMIQQGDQREFNWFLYRDDTQDGRWRMLPEDLDRVMQSASSQPPYNRCLGLDATPGNEICRAFMAVPEFETMFNRRLRTLIDEVLSDSAWIAQLQATEALIQTDWNEDEAKWNRTNQTLTQLVDTLESWFIDYAAHIRTGGHDGMVPAIQSPNPAITISSVRPDEGDGIAWALLTNPSATEAIDISNWTFEGIGTITPGAVVLPGATIAVTNDDAAFRAAQPAFNGVRVWLDGTIAGQTRLLRRNGSEAAVLGVAPPASLLLNEWNAVSASNLLAEPDPAFGPVAGNGGDWFELIVVDDFLDVRGWRLVLSDSDGGGAAVRDEFVFADRAELASLEAGTIITVSESLPDDLSWSPIDGDWHLNFQANAADAGAFFTPESQENFDTNHEDWQLAIYDAAGDLVFGPAGEGIGDLTGVNSSEIGELEVSPSTSVSALTDYGDGDSSTFGQPNVSDDVPQDFTALRWPYVRGDVDCDQAVTVLDALQIAQLEVDLRSEAGRCPVVDSEVESNSAVGDFDRDGSVTVLDALTLAQCTVGIENAACPAG